MDNVCSNTERRRGHPPRSTSGREIQRDAERKFSQVEFVGVLVGLFRDFKVRPVPKAGENDAMARDRLAAQIRDDTGMRLLLQMLHPKKAVLQWTKR